MRMLKCIATYVIMVSLIIFKHDTVDLHADTMITNDSICVKGFQIRTNDTEEVGVAFRAVCKTPAIGSVIAEVSGEEYRIKKVGTSYTIDINSVYGVEDTYLGSELKSQVGPNGNVIDYYDGVNGTHTKGYIATSEGIISDWAEEDDDLYYIRTMTNCDFSLATRYLVRAFAVAESDSGKEIIVYGSDVKEITIAEIAEHIYVNSMASNYQGHCFLFDKILNVERDNYNINKYYRQNRVDYGWNDNLFTPENPTIIISQ